MKSTIFAKSFAVLLLVFTLTCAALAQDGAPPPQPNMFKVGDSVEADYMGWYPGKVVEVKPEGYPTITDNRWKCKLITDEK